MHTGDEIVLLMCDETSIEPNPSLRVPIVFEDRDAVVFDKPVNMPVHPSVLHRDDTLGNCFAHLYPDVTYRPVNRLDKDTSGLCVIAKNAYAAPIIAKSLQKVYTAAVTGILDCGGTIDAPIGRCDGSIIGREVRSDGQKAVTHYTVLDRSEDATLVRVTLENGRTHQIRVHFAHIGHPLVGDTLYGTASELIPCQALHCSEMTFSTPSSGKVALHSEPRNDMINIFRK